MSYPPIQRIDSIEHCVLDKIIERLERIESKLNQLLEQQAEVKQNTVQMVDHISFIHRVYVSVRTPLNAITSWFSGEPVNELLPSAQLPQIASGEENNY